MKLMYISLLRVFLVWSKHYFWISDGSTMALQVGTTDRNSREIMKILKDDESSIQVRPVINIDVLVGKTAELQCGNQTNEESRWWQTPFGSFEGDVYSDKYPLEISGNLKILKATWSHAGLYHCLTVDHKARTIHPFRVNVIKENIQKPRVRKDREVRETSDSHFAAAVASSVLVTFVVAFSLGAFSQPYLIKWLQETRGKICPKNQSHRSRENIFRFGPIKKSTPGGTVFFRRGQNPEDDDVAFAPTRSTNTFRSKQANRDEAQLQEQDSEIQENINNSQTEEAGDEPDQAKCDEREVHDKKEVSEPDAQKQPKRKSRVIRLYNYDEEGNKYSHIKEPEKVEDRLPSTRQRVLSLTRLSNIMSQVDSFDFSATRDGTNSSAKPDDQPSET